MTGLFRNPDYAYNLRTQHKGICLILPLLFSAVVFAQTSEDSARAAFKAGVEAFQAKQFEQAEKHLSQVPELGDYLSLYKHWYLGQALLEIGKYKEAEPEFLKVMQGQASSELKYQAQYLLGEAALRQQKYSEASHRLYPLEKKWRRSYRLPEVLYRLMQADLKMGRTDSACRRARRLYSNHPAHALVIGWGNDLKQVEVDGKKLPCTLAKDDFSKRVRALQHAGESEKAHKEITGVMGKLPESEKLNIDLILANFLVNEGFANDGLNLLVRYYPKQKGNQDYLSLLGKAAARSGEYQTAVGAYERAHSISPSSKRGARRFIRLLIFPISFKTTMAQSESSNSSPKPIRDQAWPKMRSGTWRGYSICAMTLRGLLRVLRMSKKSVAENARTTIHYKSDFIIGLGWPMFA